MNSRFDSLESVIQVSSFPLVDLALRRGRHIDRDDGELYCFLSDAQTLLEGFYHRFGCELIFQADGYFYLLPTGEQFMRRHLTAAEMLTGQTLALQHLDPGTLQTAGVVTRSQILTRMQGLVGDVELARAFEPRKKRLDNERVVHDIIRKRFAEALRTLSALGFIDLLDGDQIRLRSPLLRFAEPVRSLQDVVVAMERLINRKEIIDLKGTEKQHSASAGSDEGEIDVEDIVEEEDGI